jgi:hypothetical protein
MSQTQAIMLRVAERHGFAAWATGEEKVTVLIPWVHSITGDKGDEVFVCASVKNVMEAIGY